MLLHFANLVFQNKKVTDHSSQDLSNNLPIASSIEPQHISTYSTANMSSPQDNRDNAPNADELVDGMNNLNVGGDEGRLGPDGEPLPKTDEEYAESQLTLRAIVSSKEAGVIIGKGGKNVADLRDETGVKAGVSKVVQGVHDRVLTIAGGCEAISKAYAIVARALLEGAPQVGMGGVVSNNGTHRK
jgi:heterogeneous nuclear rnp K-like protein 2